MKPIPKPADMSKPVIPDGQIGIQRVPIHLPGFTTVLKLEPRYVYPLYKALWKFRDPKAPVHNSEDSVRILDSYPPGLDKSEAWLVIDEDMAMEGERARLEGFFGKHPGTGELLFDVVYPGDSFEQAFEAAVKSSLSIKSTEDINPSIAELSTLDSVGAGLAVKLYERGVKSARDVAMMNEDELAKIIGKTRAPKAKADAEARFDKTPPVPAENA